VAGSSVPLLQLLVPVHLVLPLLLVGAFLEAPLRQQEAVFLERPLRPRAVACLVLLRAAVGPV